MINQASILGALFVALGIIWCLASAAAIAAAW